MDRRLLLAIGLMLIVALLPSILWPPDRTAAPGASGPAGDTAALVTPSADSAAQPTVQDREPSRPEPVPSLGTPGPVATASDTVPERTVVVESPLYEYRFAAAGARLISATLREYQSFSGGDSGQAQLLPRNTRFLAFAFISGRDTLPFEASTFTPDADELQVGPGGATLVWTGTVGRRPARITYRFQPDEYVFDVEGEIEGGAEGVVTVGLGPRLHSVDADTAMDIRTYGVVTKANRTERLDFRSLDPGERRELVGPFEWVAIKSKYFVAALLTLEPGQPQFGGALAVGLPKEGRYETDVDVTASLPSSDGRFRMRAYIGPQEYKRLKAIGHDFDDVNPYGWILRPVIRPVVDYLILPVLLWMHETLNLAYGWVLIVFGIAIRIILWPLNQKAMRSSMAMQAIQPEMKVIQEKYKNDPPRQQQEMLKLYREHGANPLGGCLPMLIPMPVLFALFFVFANTIEFRGVSFLWLPDLSRADPYFIIPIVMGASMFVLSWLGQRGVPPNPQAKMMMYLMPGMFTFLFLRFSSGLNLYYAVSNLASLPQQWLISRERQRRLGQRSG